MEPERFTRPCRWCGAEFAPRRLNQRFCSARCREEMYRPGLRRLQGVIEEYLRRYLPELVAREVERVLSQRESRENAHRPTRNHDTRGGNGTETRQESSENVRIP